jgi:hypothetical protein
MRHYRVVMVVGTVSAVDISDILGDFSDHRAIDRREKMTRERMTPELKHALEVIKSECKKNVRLCSRCPLAAWRLRGERQCRITGANIENVRPWPYSPCDWDIDACAQEDENGRS